MKGTKLLSQSPILQLLYKREEDIKDFKPRPFWKLKGDYKDLVFDHYYYNTKYSATIEQADGAIEYLRDEGFTTYPRTNGHFFAKDNIIDVENSYKNSHKVFKSHPYIMKYKTAKITTKNAIFNDIKASKQNHTPIVITDKTPTEKDFKKWESALNKGKKLKKVKEAYFLIANRFMIQILPDDLIEKQNLIIDINGNLFETSGEKAINQGWRELTGDLKRDTSFKTDLKKGDEIKLDKIKTIESLTKKPPMYNVPSLQKTMVNVNPALEEEILSIEDIKERKKKRLEYADIKKIFKEIEGIGTNATRKNIILNLQGHKYIDIKGAKSEIKLTDNGRFLVEHLPEYLKDIATTAKWEVELEKVRLGEITYDDFVNAIDDFYINKILPEVFKQFEKEKGTLNVPSEKQINFAKSIADKKGIEVDKEALKSR